MKVSRAAAAENRERMLAAAARLFREHGLSGVGVDALTQAAGMTHGSLYSQFGSKDQLAAEALRHAAVGSAARFDAVGSLADYAEYYLSADHRDHPGTGCAVAALGCDMPRQSGPVRRSFTELIKAMSARLAGLLPASARHEDRHLAIAATLVGALILARGVDDAALGNDILAAARRHIGDSAPTSKS